MLVFHLFSLLHEEAPKTDNNEDLFILSLCNNTLFSVLTKYSLLCNE